MNLKLEDLRPINNMLLVKNDPVEEATTKTLKSGLIMVQSEESRPKSRDTIATIIKVGDHVYDKFGNKHDLKETFKPGDRIMYYNPAGTTKITIEDETYVLLRAEDIDLIIEDKED